MKLSKKRVKRQRLGTNLIQKSSRAISKQKKIMMNENYK